MLPPEGKYQFLAIVTKENGVLISRPVSSHSGYLGFSEKLLFDGLPAESTFHKDWKKIANPPSLVQLVVPEIKKNVRLVLKEGYPVTPETPQEIDSCNGWDEDEQFYAVRGIYEEKFDMQPGEIKEVSFDLNVIAERDSFEFVEIDRSWNVRPSLMTAITTPPVLHQELPCSMTKEQSYKIIREYVKRHIDRDYAQITSDYDFCFTVQKRIELSAIEHYMVDANIMKNTKRKKMIGKTRSERKITVFQMAPKAYQGYTVIDPFVGKDHADLIKKVKSYLKKLMKEINEPIVDCPHCEGMGVILKEGK